MIQFDLRTDVHKSEDDMLGGNTMKHLKKTFVSALLAVAMLITSFLSLGSVSAAALSLEYDGSASIYYLFDYCMRPGYYILYI